MTRPISSKPSDVGGLVRHIVLVGFGNMGRALAKGWQESGTSHRIAVVETSAEARRQAEDLGLRTFPAPDQVDGAIDVAVLAVKPAALEAVLAALPPAGLYLSIAAGRSIAEIRGLVAADAPIVRAMPNTPAAIGRGVTGLCAGRRVGSGERSLCSELMLAVGAVEWLDDERDMDALTAVSGSGPAYVFLLIECLTAAAIETGLEPKLAARLATATVAGAGAYALQSGVDAGELRRQVTSPGGTTEAALSVLLEGDALERLLRSAVAAATARSRELGSGPEASS
jgi:pyrroline-5-carboxylate reductase